VGVGEEGVEFAEEGVVIKGFIYPHHVPAPLLLVSFIITSQSPSLSPASLLESQST
jgi:hypothetical protein